MLFIQSVNVTLAGMSLDPPKSLFGGIFSIEYQ